MKYATTILALFAFALSAEAQTTKWTLEDDAKMKAELKAGKTPEEIAQELGHSARRVRARAKVYSIAVPEAPKIDLTDPSEKRVLVTAYQLNQIDLALIEALKSKGYVVLFCGPDEIPLTKEATDWANKTKAPETTSSNTGFVVADFLPGELTAESVKAFRGFVFPDADRSTGMKLPIEAILQSPALIVMGEAPNIQSGEKLLLSTPLSGNASAKAYQLQSAPHRVAYVVSKISGKGMTKNMATESGDQKFASEKLLPAVLTGL